MTITKTFMTALVAFTVATASAPAIAQAEDAAVETAGAEVLHEGSWTKKSFKVSGTWSIFEEDGKLYVKLSDDFKTRNAPDLKIFLSPLSASEANGGNATDGSLLISPLQSNKGGQVYEIPAGTDLDSFSSILIHCEQFSKLWSASDL